jgi:peptidoglycan/xylan/chitin deacetylase (PgdA/CDA1 family)
MLGRGGCAEGEKGVVYLTFDDGPHPEITEWVVSELGKYGVKGTFFCVGENVERYREVYGRVLEAGHSVGNHTYNHLDGLRVGVREYVANVEAASQVIAGRLFRAPHGVMRVGQWWELRKRYEVVWWDIVTRDYSSGVSVEDIVEVVKWNVGAGSIIVFHDSERAWGRLERSLGRVVAWLLEAGYRLEGLR